MISIMKKNKSRKGSGACQLGGGHGERGGDV